jgi:putative ABC transport system permease protein
MRLTQWFEDFRSDAIFALRQLRGAPAFTAIAALTLALGIGANGAIFALVDAALLRPLEFRDPDRLVKVWELAPSSARTPAAPLNVADWLERTRTFDAFGGHIGGVGAMVMSGVGSSAESVSRQWVTSGFFDVLGVPAIAGRTFKPSDDDSQEGEVVLNESFWRSRFGGDPNVIGRKIRFDGQPYTVVGVAPRWFQQFGRTNIWAIISPPRIPQMRTAYFVQTIGRMKPGVTLEAAGDDLARVAATLALELPQTNAGRGVVVEPIRAAIVGSEVRLTAMLFLGVVGLVLLICCANVANLLLARATARARELAVRLALGAGRRRVLRQLLTESLILSTIGGGLGAAVGALILEVAPSLMPEGLLPSAVTLAFDTRVAAFCAVATVGVGLVFGLTPAWQATGTTSSIVASDSRGATARGGRLRALLVAGEVATAVVLLFGAGLLLRTLLALEHVDRGYRADRVLSMMVDPLASEYREPGSLQRFFEAVEREARQDPAVSHVAWASTLPLGESQAGSLSFEIVGDPPVDARQRPTADEQIVSPAYFETIDLPIVAGRGFTDRDGPNSPLVCIVNEAFVRRFLGGRAPIGVRVQFYSDASPQPQIRQVVGVARQVRARPDETEDLIQVYAPIAQRAIDDIYLLARPAVGPAEALAPSIRAAVARVDTAQLVNVAEVMTLDDVAHVATSRHRFRAVAVVTFAALALLLAMVGVFGVMAYSIQQRLREFGVRMALGATRADMLRLVLANGAAVVTSGVAAGLVLAAFLARLLETVLFGVQPLDPVTFGMVVVLLLVTAALSTAVPAWRATRVDPAAIMKGE